MSKIAASFTKTALRYPDRIALECKDEEAISYWELNREVDQVVTELVRKGACAGDRIALLLPKSPKSVVAILAVLRLGAAYVPLDFSAPFSRNRFVISVAKPRLVLAVTELPEALDGNWEQSPISINGDNLVVLAAEKYTRDAQSGLAYILFTSGSTGQPKGVAIRETAALAFVNWARSAFQLSHQDTVASVAPFHFDLSVFDLHATLTTGARLLLITDPATKNPRLLASELAEGKVTLLYTTPTLLRLLVTYGKCEGHNFLNLRQILYAGEAYPVADLIRLMQAFPHVSVANLYGPTETNVVTFHELPGIPDAEGQKDIPIGKACPYAQLMLWDAGPVDRIPGAEGELLVAGTSLATGYLDRQATDSAFIDYNGNRFYHTGDLVRVDVKDRLIFLGRKDRMVKRRGYRIEPAEIEAALQRHSGVSYAAVTVGIAKDGGVKLVAHFETVPDQPVPNKLELLEHCRECLPLYMVPDGFRHQAKLPLTTSQKIDYAALQIAVNEK